MAINYEKLLNYPIPEVRQTLRWQDVALYNFSVGLGQDPMDERQLDFLYEPRLKAMRSRPGGGEVSASGGSTLRALPRMQ